MQGCVVGGGQQGGRVQGGRWHVEDAWSVDGAGHVKAGPGACPREAGACREGGACPERSGRRVCIGLWLRLWVELGLGSL